MLAFKILLPLYNQIFFQEIKEACKVRSLNKKNALGYDLDLDFWESFGTKHSVWTFTLSDGCSSLCSKMEICCCCISSCHAVCCKHAAVQVKYTFFISLGLFQYLSYQERVNLPHWFIWVQAAVHTPLDPTWCHGGMLPGGCRERNQESSGF